MKNIKNKSTRVTRLILSLAEYDYEIEYKKGSLNSNADALSRIELETNNLQYINNVLSNRLQENIKTAQQEDEVTREIINNIKYNKNFVEDEILYRKTEKRITLVIPRSLKENVLRMCHNDMRVVIWYSKRHGQK